MRLPSDVPALVSQSRLLGRVPPGQTLTLTLVLPLRDPEGLDDLLLRLQDPSDPLCGHYLTPTQFYARFGPLQTDVDAVTCWARAQGFVVTPAAPGSVLLNAKASAATIEAAFGVHLCRYQAPDGRVFHAPDVPPAVPFALSRGVIGIVGLDNARTACPLRQVSFPTTGPGTGVNGALVPSDIKTAYGLSGLNLDGTGQTLALFELDLAFNPKDILKYAHAVGQTPVPLEVVPVDGGSSAFTAASSEICLDIDMEMALAPRASKILVYEAPFDYNGGNGNGALDELQRIANDNRAQTVSLSYGFGAESGTTPSAYQKSLDTIFKQMAAQGQSVFVASGDSGSVNSGTGTKPNVDILASEPNVCCVGGTRLAVKTPRTDERYKSETTWNTDGYPADGASGGGISKQWAIPSYQTAAAGKAFPGASVSRIKRNLPDVSLNADPSTGYLIYCSTDPQLPGPGFYTVGGTSAAAPLWAAFTALVNQNRARLGLAALGFPNTALYAQGPGGAFSGNYASVFHDIADGSNNSTDGRTTDFTALGGLDDATGLGTFQGSNLLVALSGPAP